MPEPNMIGRFVWNGRDDGGAVALGSQWAEIEVAAIYQGGSGRYPWDLRVWGGTLGTWDTRAHGMGGWSLNVHHFFDPNERILYLGSGGQRSGEELGRVQELSGTDQVLIASENGIAVYYFDADTGRHLETRNALTGAQIYSFSYAGDLLTAVSGPNGTTTIGGGEINPPFGPTTTFASDDADDFWTTIANPVSSMAFSFEIVEDDVFDVPRSTDPPPPGPVPPLGGGLLATVSDPNGGLWEYAYDPYGSLVSQGDAGDGTITATRSEGVTGIAPDASKTVAEAYEINLKTAGDDNFTHKVIEYEDGSADRQIVTPDGTTTFDVGSDLSESGTVPFGAGGSFTRIRRAGAVLSLDTPLPFRLGSLSADYQVGDGSFREDLTGTVGFTQTTKWNNAVTTTVASGNTITTTTPGNRTIVTTTDSQGRPESIALPGLPPISISYGSQGPTSITQGGRRVGLAYGTGAFVESITDPLGRTVTLGRDAGGRVSNQDVFGLQSFGFDYDDNGNVKKVTSPQAAGYEENFDYTDVDLVESFELPAGQTSVSYDADRKATGGNAPQGTLDFDGEGRLTDIGDIAYGYDADDYVESITSPDGGITYAYGGNPVPTSISWSGPVSGTVSIGRNALFQATSVGVGSFSADLNPDADGVQRQAGEMTLVRDAATFLESTQLDNVSDRYARNQFGEPTFYEAVHSGNVLFSESYTRDKGGRIKRKDVRIVDPGTGNIEAYTARYEYYPTGQLQLVQYNNDPPIEYIYDANNNLLGEPAAPSGAIFVGPSRLHLKATAATAQPSAFTGTWQSTIGHESAEMAFEPDGAVTETSISAASCTEDDKTLVNVFVSPQLATGYAIGGDEQIRIVLGAHRAEVDDDLTPIVSLWLMDSSGAERCQIAVDHTLTTTDLPEGTAEGITGFVNLEGTACANTVAQAGDRLVAEIGYRCDTDSSTAVEAVFTRGGTGPALTSGGDPTEHACGNPGYIEIDGAWPFTSPAGSPCTSDPQQTISTRRLESVEIGGSNQATRAVLTEPDGTPRDYTYTYDTNGALDTKTDTLTGEVTDYDYDDFGNLRNVNLPGNGTIEYLIDAANRRVGRVERDDLGTIIGEKRYLYQSALRPVAEMDGSNQITAFFVYADKPNVPEYMVRVEGGQNVKYRIVTDHLGSVRLVVNANDGTIAQRIDYDEWGNVTQDTNPGFQPFGFAGGVSGGVTGVVRFGARDYDPASSRWTSLDPPGFGSRSVANLYTYPGAEPVNWIDPSGWDAIRVVYVGYPVDTGFGFKLPLGHAAVISVDPKTGYTRYYEYGRYDSNFGQVKRRTIPDLRIGDDGKPTSESLTRLYGFISRRYGKGRPVSASYYADADCDQVIAFAEGIKNDDQRAPYRIPTNTCYTFSSSAVAAGRAATEAGSGASE